MRDLGEADRLVTLFSGERGKLRAVARGARRSPSRLAGALQPLAHLRCQLAQARTLDIITQVELVDSFPPVRQDLTLVTYGHHFLELVDVVASEREASDLFPLLLSHLHLLAGGIDSELVSRAFELRLLAAAGFGPSLHDCARCGRPVGEGEEFGFNAAAGGVLCPACAGGTRLRPGVRGSLIYLAESDLRQLGRLRAGERDRAEMESMLRALLAYHLDRPLRSLAFLDTLRGGAP